MTQKKDLVALSKAELKAWADAQPIPDLPEEPEAYFLLDHPETRLIPVAALRARRDPEEDAASVHRAMVLAAAARAGRLPKRAPITVSVEEDDSGDMTRRFPGYWRKQSRSDAAGYPHR